ncbi:MULTISPECIES: methyltransferase domain-containing protein [Actinomadura]|uniref:Protein-L-isoaspartate O-methyltransferase n=1 Tax=Actinomadura yumaensis TaxID=111807 RepID=A0ABW2CYI2_9ACTN|nr:methyltransferase domain-containing protein [Actinomadura sp. J1-007]MWK34214.1 methyltransferase domain-containing protein [Actinomadura sp. J1-007]
MDASDVRRAVPRELFVPERVWVRREDGWMVPLLRSEEPEEWERLVASDDEAVITQVDDGAHEKGTWPTSSSSSPEIMAIMLDALDVREGMRVLEIGTGTGYNAAVLASRAGPRNVTTVEIDPEISARAREALDKAGFAVRVVTGEGAEGYPPGAPYDRVIVTAAVHRVPYVWVEQTRPGGVIVVPWGPTFHPEWPLARLVVGKDGVAEGRFTGPSSFMPLRGQRVPQAVMHEAEERWERAGRPECGRYGVTVGPDGQVVWLDEPSKPV